MQPTVLPSFIEVSIVKDQEVLVLIIQALDGMCGTFGEVPNITNVESVDLVFTILINGRDDYSSGVYKAPFSLLKSAPELSYKRMIFLPHGASATLGLHPSSDAAELPRYHGWRANR